MLGLLEEKLPSRLVPLSSTLCDFPLGLETHQTSHQSKTTSRRREAEAGSSGNSV